LWLWTVAVKPVLKHLGLLEYQEERPGQLPKVWWVGSGLMALAPIHAAGDHSPNSKENTLSHVVSSYASTIKALAYSRQQPWAPLQNKGSKVLVVSMPNTPGHSNLNVSEELEAIRKATESKAQVLQRPTKQEVLDVLADKAITHFACHGYCHPQEPQRSGLLLGNSKLERLTVRDLGQLKYRVAQIAYLSACSTAEIRSDVLVDESIHLANMFQLLGYRHVIGTMWGAYDAAAVKVAKSFYKELFLAEGNDGLAVAEALHNAVLTVRKQDCQDSIRWAPFVHFGA
jgi:CHAT domain-containing protein